MMNCEKLDRICDMLFEMDSDDIAIIKKAIEGHEKRLFGQRVRELIEEGQGKGYTLIIETNDGELFVNPHDDVTITAY